MKREGEARAGERDGDTGDPLAGVRFRPRASLGPEIVGRARRGEVAKGGLRPRRVPSLRLLAACGATLAAVAVGWLAFVPRVSLTQSDHCCINLDGGGPADDGYVVEARGRRIARITLYEDRDGDGRLSTGDPVRLVRGAAPALSPDSVAATVRVCCADLDGEGPADDGLLVLHGADERVVLAGVFEQRGDAPHATLR